MLKMQFAFLLQFHFDDRLYRKMAGPMHRHQTLDFHEEPSHLREITMSGMALTPKLGTAGHDLAVVGRSKLKRSCEEAVPTRDQDFDNPVSYRLEAVTFVP